MRVHDPRRRSGFVLYAAVVAIGVVLVTGALIYRFMGQTRGASRAYEELAEGNFSAEGVVRLMMDRLQARAEYKLGVLDSLDLAELNAEIGSIPVPDGVVLDMARTQFRIVEASSDVVIPYDTDPLKVVSDMPRSDSGLFPDFSGVTASRSLEIAMIAVTTQGRIGERAAVARLRISKVLPHQRVFHIAGDAEVCVSSGSTLLVQGRTRAEGTLTSRCGGSRLFAGEVYAGQAVDVVSADGGSHVLKTPSGDVALSTLDRSDAEADVKSMIAQYGGRVRVGAGIGDKLVSTTFQDSVVAGTGECGDFDGACFGTGQYNPSVTLFKADNANSPGYSVSCGPAYTRAGNPTGCVTQVNAATTYTAYPFAVAPNGSARIDPGTNLYWHGLFPDVRRQNSCLASVNGSDIRTYRCDTAPYGYVIDMGRLGKVQGGLLSIRKTQNAAGTFNPSGYQEVVVLTNARTLYGDLTIHSELPVYVAGSFNTYASRSAVIDAPMVTVLPGDFQRQIQTDAAWDSVPPLVTPRPLRSAEVTEIHGLIRTRFSPTAGGVYFGGSAESTPHVLGDFTGASVEIHGAIEATPWKDADGQRYSAFHKGYNQIPPTHAVSQPAYRVWRYDARLSDPETQPPGSWSAENLPLSANGAATPRSYERQQLATGGFTVMTLVQEPTRLPRAEAVSVVLPCDPYDADCGGDVGDQAPVITSTLVCSPATVYALNETTCSASAEAGTFPLLQWEFDWGDGTTTTVTNGSSSVVRGKAFGIPGTYTVRVRVVDTNFAASGWVSTTVLVQALPGSVTLACAPTTVKPSWPEPPGQVVGCTTTFTKGSYNAAKYVWLWGDGSVDTVSSAAGVQSSGHAYDSLGVFVIDAFVIDQGGVSSNHAYTNVTARHLPPTLTSFTCSPATVEPAATVSCTGSATDGTTSTQTLNVVWDGSATSSAGFSGGTAVATHEYHTGAETIAEDQAYTVSAVAVDAAGNTSNELTFSVSVVTDPPVLVEMNCAPAGLIYTGQSKNCAVLASAGTFGLDVFTIEWGVGQGSSVISASTNPNSAIHTYNLAGTYTIRTTVTDARGNVSPGDSITFVVSAYRPPTADAIVCSPNPVDVGAATTCTIAYNGSMPSTYPVDRFAFVFGDGTADTVAAASRAHTYGAENSYTVLGSVRDSSGVWSATTSTIVSVVRPLDAPTILSFNCTDNSMQVGETTGCSATADAGSASIDRWETYCDVGGSSTVTVTTSTAFGWSCSYASEGTYTARARAHNGDGLWSPWSSDWSIVVSSTPPAVISASVTCGTPVVAGELVSCSGGASPASDPNPVRWRWQWQSGVVDTVNSTATSESASHTYSVAGGARTETVILYVDFSDGRTASASQAVTLSAPVDPTVSLSCPSGVQESVSFECTATPNGGISVSNFHWNWGDGATGNVAGSGTTASTQAHSYGSGTAGNSYTVTVIVTWANGAAPDTVSANVNVLAGSPPMWAAESTCRITPTSGPVGGVFDTDDHYVTGVSAVIDSVTFTVRRSTDNALVQSGQAGMGTMTGYAQFFGLYSADDSPYAVTMTAHNLYGSSSLSCSYEAGSAGGTVTVTVPSAAVERGSTAERFRVDAVSAGGDDMVQVALVVVEPGNASTWTQSKWSSAALGVNSSESQVFSSVAGIYTVTGYGQFTDANVTVEGPPDSKPYTVINPLTYTCRSETSSTGVTLASSPMWQEGGTWENWFIESVSDPNNLTLTLRGWCSPQGSCYNGTDWDPGYSFDPWIYEYVVETSGFGGGRWVRTVGGTTYYYGATSGDGDLGGVVGTVWGNNTSGNQITLSASSGQSATPDTISFSVSIYNRGSAYQSYLRRDIAVRWICEMQ